jgi:hypothetical protein
MEPAFSAFRRWGEADRASDVAFVLEGGRHAKAKNGQSQAADNRRSALSGLRARPDWRIPRWRSWVFHGRRDDDRHRLQAHIAPLGTNSLGTASSARLPGGTTVGANMEPKDSRPIDAAIRDENSRIDSKINNICKGC